MGFLEAGRLKGCRREDGTDVSGRNDDLRGWKGDFDEFSE